MQCHIDTMYINKKRESNLTLICVFINKHRAIQYVFPVIKQLLLYVHGCFFFFFFFFFLVF